MSRFSVHVYYPAAALTPAEAPRMLWLGIPNGDKVTLDGAVLAARKHIGTYRGASMLVRRDGANLLLIQKGECWDLQSGQPVSL